MNDKPLHYKMAPQRAASVNATELKLAALVHAGLHDIDELGATSNDRLSALAEWTALLVSAGVLVIEARVRHLALTPNTPTDMALNIFLQDVIQRLAGRPRKEAGDGET